MPHQIRGPSGPALCSQNGQSVVCEKPTRKTSLSSSHFPATDIQRDKLSMKLEAMYRYYLDPSQQVNHDTRQLKHF